MGTPETVICRTDGPSNTGTAVWQCGLPNAVSIPNVVGCVDDAIAVVVAWNTEGCRCLECDSIYVEDRCRTNIGNGPRDCIDGYQGRCRSNFHSIKYVAIKFQRAISTAIWLIGIRNVGESASCFIVSTEIRGERCTIHHARIANSQSSPVGLGKTRIANLRGHGCGGID